MSPFPDDLNASRPASHGDAAAGLGRVRPESPGKAILSGLLVLAFALLAACDQGFKLAPASQGGAETTPAVAFKTPRTTPTPETQPTATAQPAQEQSAASPTVAAATAAPTTAPAQATVTTAVPTIERTLIPSSPAASPTAEGEIPGEIRNWVIETLANRQAGTFALRPFEIDPDFEISFETNNIVQGFPPQLVQSAFDAGVKSFYAVQADRQLSPADPDALRRPVFMFEQVIVHESEDAAASFVGGYRDQLLRFLSSLSEQFIQQISPNAEGRVQQEQGFGIAEEELFVVTDYDLKMDSSAGRPQVYIMIARQRHANIALMVLYLDSQPRLRPFGLLDRLVAKVA